MRLHYEHARGTQTYVAILQSSALREGRAITVATIVRAGPRWRVTWEHRELLYAGPCTYADTLKEARALVEHALFDYLER